MKTILIAALTGALALTGGVAEAQKSTRVRGTIAGLAGVELSVKTRDGKVVAIRLAEKTVIVFTQPIALSDIKPGDFLGVTSVKGEGGALTAFEVRRFPKPLNPGHRRFDGRDDQTMTNATVSAMVQSASGRELTLTYQGGSQKIVVPEDASISMLVPGHRSQLVAGARVNLTARPDNNERLTAVRIQVSPPR
jgi:outer membrane lipoprotein SlyB